MAPVVPAVDAPEQAGRRSMEGGARAPTAHDDACGTAIGPRLCSGVDDLALQRMHSKGADRWHFRQAAWQGLPLVAAVGQPKQPGVYHPAFSGFTSEAKVKMGG